MRFNFQDYLPPNFDIFKTKLDELNFPNKRTYYEYLVWKFDTLRLHFAKKIEIEREKNRDHTYVHSEQIRRGLKVIKKTQTNYDDRIDLILREDEEEEK